MQNSLNYLSQPWNSYCYQSVRLRSFNDIDALMPCKLSPTKTWGILYLAKTIKSCVYDAALHLDVLFFSMLANPVSTQAKGWENRVMVGEGDWFYLCCGKMHSSQRKYLPYNIINEQNVRANPTAQLALKSNGSIILPKIVFFYLHFTRHEMNSIRS